MHFMILALMWGLTLSAVRAEDSREWDAEQEECEGVSCDDAFDADPLIHRIEVYDPHLLNWKNFHPSQVAQGACSHYHWKVEGKSAKLKDLKVTWHDNMPWRPLCLSFIQPDPSVRLEPLPRTAEVRRPSRRQAIKPTPKSWWEHKGRNFDEWKFDRLSWVIGVFMGAMALALGLYGPRRKSR